MSSGVGAATSAGLAGFSCRSISHDRSALAAPLSSIPVFTVPPSVPRKNRPSTIPVQQPKTPSSPPSGGEQLQSSESSEAAVISNKPQGVYGSASTWRESGASTSTELWVPVSWMDWNDLNSEEGNDIDDDIADAEGEEGCEKENGDE